MKNHLINLMKHMVWADAIHWKMMEGKPESFDDKEISERLFHIHFVQFAFLKILTGQPLERKRSTDFTLEELKKLGENTGKELLSFVSNLTDEQMNNVVRIPWFKDAGDGFSFFEAINQVAMHSHYHRGQNASRFRQLGGTPEMTDYIYWLFLDRK
ncbi:MAG: DinB family protein [Ignavibacteria bacterium]|nr:DinB family protein [Ignavibacteria bacterium]